MTDTTCNYTILIDYDGQEHRDERTNIAEARAVFAEYCALAQTHRKASAIALVDNGTNELLDHWENETRG
jgi:hypothetical protein